MMRFILLFFILTSIVRAESVTSKRLAPLPIDPLWQSDLFRKTVTGSFGIDSRIEPRITVDEEFYLDASAKKMEIKDRDGAIKVLRDCSLLAESPILLFSLATFEFEAGELELAVVNLNKALTKFPNFRDAHRNLAIILVQQEEYKGAVEHLVRAIELGSRESISMGLLGYCHAVQNHHQAALDAYRLASLTQPAQRQWKKGEAHALQTLSRSQQAVSIFQQLIDEKPDELNLWLAQADNWIALKRPIDAIVNLELAHRANELTADAILSLGHLYLQNGLPELALQRYQLAMAQNAAPVSLNRAIEALELLANTAEWEKAVILSKQIRDTGIFPAKTGEEKIDSKVFSRFYRMQALIELEVGNAKEGERLIAEWLSKEPLDGLALILLARFKEQGDAREEAEMLLERAELLPEYAAAAHRAHGKLLVNTRDYDRALKHLEQSQTLEPSATLADYVRAVKELLD